MSKLLSQGGFGCVYYPGLKCSGKTDVSKKMVTKLQRDDFNADNEAYIGKIIVKMPNYNMFFLPVIDTCQVSIRNINSNLIKDCEIISKDDKKKFVLMTIPYISNKSFLKMLTDYTVGKKQIILGIIDTYSYLLTTVQYMMNMGIVHFDLKGDNILYNLDSLNPQIIDFGISLHIDKLTPDTWSKYFYAYAPEYYVWPLEVHLINYLLHRSPTLDEKAISEIANECVSNNKGLDVFADDFRAKYKDLCKICLRKYMNKSKDKLIPELISQYKTWDNYSISILYLKTLSYMFPHGFHRNKVIILLSQLFLLNISPDYSTRLSLEETRQKFSDIFFVDGDVRNYMSLVESVDYDPLLTTRKIQEDIDKLQTLKIKSIHSRTK